MSLEERTGGSWTEPGIDAVEPLDPPRRLGLLSEFRPALVYAGCDATILEFVGGATE